MEIVIAGKPDSEQMLEMKATVLRKYLPNKILVYADPAADADLSLPVLEGKKSSTTQPLIYVCENYSCKQPFSTIEEFEDYYSGLLKGIEGIFTNDSGY